MEHDIKFIKNSVDKTKRTDLEWLEEFYEFLMGNKIPEGISITRGHIPKMTTKKAMTIIWYLQEHLSVLPDNIEKCSVCDSLYDTNATGIYWESKGKHYCGGCDHLVPQNYDNNQR